jgi:undecaprenyl-diphosphatase
VDYRAYHAVNVFVVHHAWIGRSFREVETIGPILIACATFGLWLLGRPRTRSRWKLASASALAAAALGLLVNQLIARFWWRQRPFAAHHAHVWGARSHDPSFPSDHATAAFAIGFTVIFFDRVAGALFVAAAVAIGVGRVIVGAHYPGDVIAGCLVGLACAIAVVWLARPLITRFVTIAEQLTDPLVAPAWRRLGRR